MNLEKQSKLFVGLRVETALRDALAQVKESERHYFEQKDGPYLIIARFERERWIGKIVEAGLKVQEVEDVERNVLSILRRIAPDVRHSPSSLRIFHVTETTDQVVDLPDDGPVDGGEEADSDPMPAW